MYIHASSAWIGPGPLLQPNGMKPSPPVPQRLWRVVRNPVAVVEIASPTSMLTHYYRCVYVSSDSLRFQGMLANEKSKGMGDQEEGMDLADEVDMGGKVQQ